jgi:signal transduction histidine kinase
MAEPRTLAWARHLPRWAGSVRTRLAVLYSVMLFGLAAVVVGGVYAGLAQELEDQPVSKTEQWRIAVFDTPVGPRPGVVLTEQADALELFEKEVNTQALEQLREYTFAALGLLFVASLGVGWYVAGVVLRPIGRITSVAREIQATDLQRRIAMSGPDDEMKRLADTFDEMLGRIDQAFESQRHFIHEASHELRNPLAVIRTNIDVALDDPNASVDELRRAGEVVGRSAERMSTLVDDLLLYARHGTRPTREETLELEAMVVGLASEFEAPAVARDIELRTSVGPVDREVCADGPAVRRAAANLLANAVRLAPSESVIRFEAGVEDSWMWISVQDEGPGIDPADQLLIFQRFWRGNGPGARGETRSGLGLTIVRQIAEAHGGRVEVSSAAGEGSTFVLWIPAIQRERDEHADIP